MKNKKIKTNEYGISAIYEIFDKRLALILDGYRINVKPKNLFTKIFKRFIHYELVIEKPNLFSMMPKVKNMGTETNWKVKK
jgi:hypothetical protein